MGVLYRIKEFNCPYTVYKCRNCKWNYADTCNFDFDSYHQGITNTIKDCNKKLDELERNYKSCYGAEIIEMYAEIYEDFREWLKEQKC